MRHGKSLAIVGLLALIVLASARFVQVQTASASCQFSRRSLLSASPADVEKQARDYACSQFSGGSSGQTLMNRSISPTEANSLFGWSDNLCRDDKLALVVLKGDFVPSHSGFVQNPSHLTYLALVIDLKTGSPRKIMGSPHGEKMGTILNDPTLPTESPAPTPALGDLTGPDLGLPRPLLPFGQLRPCDENSNPAPTLMPPH